MLAKTPTSTPDIRSRKHSGARRSAKAGHYVLYAPNGEITARFSEKPSPKRVLMSGLPKLKISSLGKSRPANVHATVKLQGAAMAAETAPAILRERVNDFAREAARLGLPTGTALSEAEVDLAIDRLAADASDLFGDRSQAVAFMTDQPLDAQGRTGRELIRTHGIAPVVMRLDHMRFGFSG